MCAGNLIWLHQIVRRLYDLKIVNLLCELDQIIGKCLQFENWGLNWIIGKYLQFERCMHVNCYD